MNRTRVAAFVGTSADLSPMVPVLTELANADGVELILLTGVAFSADQLRAALTAEEIGADFSIVPLAPPLRDLTDANLTTQGALLSEGVSQLLATGLIDVVVVLGDRWELLYVVPPFFLARVPIVHLHGGEVTEGALDERVRHAVSKLADQHCAATPGSAARLEQMGEPPERVHLTGAPGLDRLHHVRPLSDSELVDLLGVQVQRPLGLFTYHPALADAATTARWAEEALDAALDVCGTVVATYPGFDTGREAVIEVLERADAAHPTLVLREQLGATYPAVLASCDVVVGNSSSGIIEAPGVGVPSVDIGDRQTGRERSSTVTHAREGRDTVARALESALGGEHYEARHPFDPFRDGRASKRVRDVVMGAVDGDRRKPFVNFPEPREP